jgi:hypothetical protein
MYLNAASGADLGSEADVIDNVVDVAMAFVVVDVVMSGT